MAIFVEDYSISDHRTGDARLYNLTLTGWSNGSAWVEAGRLYWRVTTGDVCELFRNEGYASGDRVAFGTITSGAVTLAADNSSGISGTVKVTHTSALESTGEIIVFYGDETDLILEMRDATSLLTSGQWESGTRFEKAFKLAKRQLDVKLMELLKPIGNRKGSTFEIDLADIAMPRQLAKAHALYVAAILERWRSANNVTKLDVANDYERRADKAVKEVSIALDWLNDDSIDAEIPANVGRIGRG